MHFITIKKSSILAIATLALGLASSSAISAVNDYTCGNLKSDLINKTIYAGKYPEIQSLGELLSKILSLTISENSYVSAELYMKNHGAEKDAYRKSLTYFKNNVLIEAVVYDRIIDDSIKSGGIVKQINQYCGEGLYNYPVAGFFDTDVKIRVLSEFMKRGL